MDKKTNTEQLIAFLKTVPDKFIISEHNRRIAARRQPEQPGRKVLRACRFCGDFKGAVEMRQHVRDKHPGGARKHRLLPKMPIGIPCQYCPEVYGVHAMRRHLRDRHPEQVRRKGAPAILQPGYHDPAGKGV